MYETIEMIIYIIILIGVLFGEFFIKVKKNYDKLNKETIDEKSFQNYAKFYGDTVLKDKEFEQKMNVIYDLIVNHNQKNINKIANKANCTYQECLIKIKYLKNQKLINNYYIDHINGKILPCTPEDQKLLDKYNKYLYNGNLQISEMAAIMPGVNMNNLNQVKDQIYKELLYLDKKDLLDGIRIDEVDRYIHYYILERKLKERDFISINCPNCGAINDVHRGGKVRCEYCQTIIEDDV